MRKRRKGYGFVCAAAAAFAFARGSHAEAADWLQSARGLKQEAIARLKRAQSPGADRAGEGKQALGALSEARKLLEKYREPRPENVARELQEVNSLIYWARKMMPLDVSGLPGVRPAEAPRGKSREQLASDYFSRAEEYARRSPDKSFLIAVRFFEVADRFQGTSWSLKAQRLSLEHQRRLLAGGVSEGREAPPPSASMSAPARELLAILRRKGPPSREKLGACDRFIREHPRDALWGEVAALRHVLSARSSTGRMSAARAYLRDYPQGQLAELVPELKKLEELNAFEKLVTALRSDSPPAEKLRSCRGFLRRFPSGERKSEVEGLNVVFSAKSPDEETAAWLRYRVASPGGALKKEADAALRRREPLFVARIREALSRNDEDNVRKLGGSYLELLPRGTASSEIRSLLNVLRSSGSDRMRSTQKHIDRYPYGAFTAVLEGKVGEWRKKGEAEAFRRLRETFAATRSRPARVGGCRDFLKAYPRGERAAEVKALSRFLGLEGVVPRPSAARKYLASYPAGAFVDTARELERELRREREVELYKNTIGKERQAGGLAACEAYLAEFPDGEHAERVRATAKQARVQIEEERKAFEELEQSLSGIASPEDGIRLCDGFRAKYPRGTHASKVPAMRRALGKRMGERTEAEAHQVLMEKIKDAAMSRVEKADACIRFLEEHRRGEHCQQVRSTLKSLAPVALGRHAGPIRAATFSTDSCYLVTSDADARIRGTGVWVWKLPEGGLSARYETRPRFTVCSAAFSPGEGVLWLGEESGGLTMWNIPGGEVVGRQRLGAGPLRAVSASRGGGVVVTASLGDSMVRSWRGSEWVPADRGFACPGGVSAVAVSPSGGQVAAGGRDGRLLFFRFGERKPAWSEINAHDGEIDCVAFSPNGRYLATASAADKTVCMWSVRSGDRAWQIKESSSSVAFVNSDVLVTGPSLRSTADAGIVAQLDGCGPVAASPDGRFAFVAGRGGEGVLWYSSALLHE